MDWIEVKLTLFGERYVASTGGGPLRVHEGRHEFAFNPGEPQRVTRAFDWEKILSRQVVAGIPLFEIVQSEEPQPDPPAAEAAAA